MGKFLLYSLFIENLFQWLPLVYGDSMQIPNIECSNDRGIEDMGKNIFHGLTNDVNPCNDFYSHICGNFVNKFERTEENLYTVLEVAQGYLRNATIVNNIKLNMERKWYHACVLQNIENELNLIKEIIRQSGGLLFPEIQHMLPERTRNWQNVMKFYSNLVGTNTFFNIQLNKDHILKIIALEKMLHVDLNQIRETAEYMFSNFENVSVRNYYDDINAAQFEFNKFVHAMSGLMANASNKGTVLSIRELQIKQNSWKEQINWLELLQALVFNTEIIFVDSDLIEVNTYVIERLSQILSITPNHAIVNYIHFDNIMNDEIMSLWTPPPDKWIDMYELHCIMRMPIYAGYSSIIKQDYFPNESEKFVKDVFGELVEQMVFEIKHSKWKKEAKKHLTKKVKKMRLLTDKVIFSSDYPYENKSYSFNITNSNVHNMMNFKRAQMKYIVEKYKYRRSTLRRNRGKREISLTSFNKVENKIEFALSHVFSTLFDIEAPNSVTYGYLGFIIGQDMAQAFNVLLWNLDAIGGYASDESINKHRIMLVKRNITKCFLQQRNSYWGENLSPALKDIVIDSTALKLAIEAFKSVYLKHLGKQNTFCFKLQSNKTIIVTEKKLFFYSLVAPYCLNPVPQTENETRF